MSKTVNSADLRNFMDKRVSVKLNGDRFITGIIRGYDQFMNLTLTESFEDLLDGSKVSLGTVVVRGNGIISIESLNA
ncbi:small nuclear ribonucleoprotein g [Anaeramoeba ignava]|uniref:Sm protein G n=1 Tax=Anaeramoeba ignava TaxID=1746090 RepID=A0A9Q0LV18_ANAIG|nr:small nuclear ribonucleoprotein g [Anaeramoeba ignava]